MEKLLGKSSGSNSFQNSSGDDIALSLAAKTAGMDENPFICCSLTLKERIVGFACCFIFGLFLSILSTFNITKPVTFATLYSLGNVCSLFSTAFLVGPIRQVKKMFERKRVIATCVYLVTLIATLVVALKTKSLPWTILLLIIQFLALIWYSLSYIPYARQAVLSMLKSCFGRK